MNYTHLIFDWDGTIANTKKLWISTYKELLLQGYNLSITEQDIATKAYGNASGVTSFGVLDYNSFNKELFDLVRKYFYKSSLFPGIKGVLNKLKTSHELFIATSTERKMLQESLEYHKLSNTFANVVTREDVVNQKPSPEAISLIVNKYKCDIKRTVIIGDSDKDIIAGQKAGVKTILFLHSQNTKYNKSEANNLLALSPNFVIHKHKELFTIFPN